MKTTFMLAHKIPFFIKSLKSRFLTFVFKSYFLLVVLTSDIFPVTRKLKQAESKILDIHIASLRNIS